MKKRLSKWGFGKNLNGEVMEQIARTRAKRRRFENKDTSFLVRKKPVRNENIDRYLQRHDISEEKLLEVSSPVNGNLPKIFSLLLFLYSIS